MNDEVWIQHPVHAFIRGRLAGKQAQSSRVLVVTEEGERWIGHNEVFSFVPMHDSEDLVQLPVLNSPSVLAALKARFLRSLIYTQCGIVLVAINPYSKSSSVDVSFVPPDEGPHVYRIAEKALAALDSNKRSQSIIISGESGAGKTTSAKLIMDHLDRLLVNSKDISKRLLATNPILEAFGNAATIRNNNSSRFGKYIKIFIADGFIKGAKIETFLLEKCRILDSSSFHIFSMINDPEALRNLESHATAAGICAEEWNRIISKVREIDALIKLDISKDESELFYWFRHKKIHARGEAIITELTADQAHSNKDALAKHLYQELFDHLVALLNGSLQQTKTEELGSLPFIGILDIYGFENLEKNGFEQLCINYANEGLQHRFILHFFHNEQLIYQQEGIIFEPIRDFVDNTDCLVFIQDKLLPCLDEQSKLSNGTDQRFVSAIIDKHMAFPAKFGQDEAFVIKHFAYDVEYQGEGFLDRNRDLVHPDALYAYHQTSNISNKKSSAGGEFSRSLRALLDTLSKTECHYIRCIKPNNQMASFKFDPLLVLGQLEACGILATIKLAKAGLPTRVLKSDFLVKFWLLGDSFEEILKHEPTSKWKLGVSMLFLGDGVLSALEKKRKIVLADRITRLQCYYRHIKHREYHRILNGLFLVQFLFKRLRMVGEIRGLLRSILEIQRHFYLKKQSSSCRTIQRYFRFKISDIPLKKPKTVNVEPPSEELTEDRLRNLGIKAQEVHQSIETISEEEASEGDILRAEIRDLKEQLAFYKQREFDPNQLLSIVELFPSPSDIFLPAKQAYRLSTLHSISLSPFFEAIKEIDSPTFFWKAFWISNTMELCSYLQQSQQTTGINSLIALEALQEQCISLFRNMQSAFFKTLSISMIEYNSITPRKSPSLLAVWLKGAPTEIIELPILLRDLNELVEALVKAQVDSTLSRPLWSWLLRSLHAHAFNHLMSRPRSFWSWSSAISIQYNIALFDDFIRSALNLFQPQNHDFNLLKQAIRLLLALQAPNANLESIYALCPDLSKSQIRHIMAKCYLEEDDNADLIDRALEELAPFANDSFLIDLQEPEYFSLQLKLVPKTPPLL